jgi:hypothetical protein
LNIYLREKLAQAHQEDLNRELRNQVLVREAKAAGNTKPAPKTKKWFSLFKVLIGKAKSQTRTGQAKPANLIIAQEQPKSLKTLG